MQNSGKVKTEKIYVVEYYNSDYDEYKEIFATTKKSKATKYVTKFNKILKKWKEYYSQFEDKQYGFSWIKDANIDNHYYRWNKLRNISSCRYKEIEIR